MAETTEIYCLTDLEARSPRLRCLHGCAPSEGAGDCCPGPITQLLALPWLLAAELHSSYDVLPVSRFVSKFPAFIIITPGTWG